MIDMISFQIIGAVRHSFIIKTVINISALIGIPDNQNFHVLINKLNNQRFNGDYFTMEQELSRIGISLPESLLEKFDVIIKKRGYSSRSEGIRDAIRGYIRYYDWMSGIEGERVGTITLAYNHHQKGIEDVLGNIQHNYVDVIKSSVHIHMDNDNCMEVIILQGEGKRIRDVFENLVKNKGLLHVKLNTIIPTEI
jgi:CopG family nickel-responsive transcriptional regulator